MNVKHLLASLLIAITSVLFTGCSTINGLRNGIVDIPKLGYVAIDYDYATKIEQNRDGVWSATRAPDQLVYPFYVYMTIERLSSAQGQQFIEVEIKTIKPDKTSTSAKRKAVFGPNISRFFVAQGPYEKEHVDMYGDYFFVFIVNGIEVGRLALWETQ